MADAQLNLRADSRQIKAATRDLQSLEKQGKDTERTAISLGKAFAVLGGVLSARQVIAYSDSYKGVQNQLRLVTGSAEELAETQEKLLRVANDTASAFDGTARLYTTLARNTQDLGLSQDRLLRVTELINKSFLVTGTTAQESAGAIRQLSQGLAAGALRGDEFNSVAEGAPEILRAVAKETGKTIGQLRDFAAQGGITAELLIRSLENYGATLDDIAARTDLAFGAKLTIANNNITKFVGGLESSSGAIGAAGDVIVTLSDNLDLLSEIAEPLAVLLGAKLVAGLSASTSAIVKKTAATIAEANAEKAAAAAALAKAEADAIAARSATIATSSTISQTGATNALTAAQGRYAIAARSASIATTALNGAMALLGGPVGLVALAAGALFIYISRADEATNSTKAFFNEIGRQREINSLQTKISETKDKIKDFADSAEKSTGGVRASFERNMRGAIAELKKLDAQLLKTEADSAESQLRTLEKRREQIVNAARVFGQDPTEDPRFQEINAQIKIIENEKEIIRLKQLGVGPSKKTVATKTQAPLLTGGGTGEELFGQDVEANAAKLLQQRREEFERLAATITDSVLTAQQRFNQQVAELNSVMANSSLSQDAYNLKLAEYTEQLSEATPGIQSMTELNKALTENLDPATAALEANRQQIEFLVEAMGKFPEKSDAIALAIQQLRAEQFELMESTKESAEVVEDEMSTFAKRAAENIQDQLGETLKDTLAGDFDDIAASWGNMLADMGRQIIAAKLAEAFDLEGILSGKGNTGGGFSGLLSGAKSLFGGFFADGGRPDPNKISIVGERGPELFVPNGVAGSIVPNGAGGQPINVSISNNFSGSVSQADAKRAAAVIARDAVAAINRGRRYS